MQMTERVILTYGLSEAEMEALGSAGLALRVVDEANAGGTLLELVEGRSVPHRGAPMGHVKIMIFSGYDIDDALKDLIQSIRKKHVFGAIMAVTTKTNLQWKFDYLIEHLLEEREDNKRFERERRAAQA